MARSFIARTSPSRSRERVIDWPFPVERDVPKIRLRVLGLDAMERANLDTVDHFAKLRKKGEEKVAPTSDVFLVRERIALVFYAVEARDEDGKWGPIADSIDELAKEPDAVITTLYQEWSQLQAEATVRPMTQAQHDLFVEELKKNTRSVPLEGLPSSWLIELCRTLASQLAASTQASERG